MRGLWTQTGSGVNAVCHLLAWVMQPFSKGCEIECKHLLHMETTPESPLSEQLCDPRL